MASPAPLERERLPGAGTVFTLRAIGVVFLARWLSSMSDVGFADALNAVAQSPFACLNLLLVFLLIALPGARVRTDRPFHPLPQWLRRSLRGVGVLGMLVAFGTVGYYGVRAGTKATLATVASTNGWLVAAPVLYLAVVWLCRPRALLRTRPALKQFALRRYAVAFDADGRTVSVWDENRRIGRYAAAELSLCATDSPAPVELVWNSPAAVGHNRRVVFRARLRGEADLRAAAGLARLLAAAGSPSVSVV